MFLERRNTPLNQEEIPPWERFQNLSQKWLVTDPRHLTIAFSVERGPSITPSRRLMGMEWPPQRKVPNLYEDLGSSQTTKPAHSLCQSLAFISQQPSSVDGLHHLSVDFIYQWFSATFDPIRLSYFSAMEQYFYLTIFQHKPNFSISEQGLHHLLVFVIK